MGCFLYLKAAIHQGTDNTHKKSFHLLLCVCVSERSVFGVIMQVCVCKCITQCSFSNTFTVSGERESYLRKRAVQKYVAARGKFSHRLGLCTRLDPASTPLREFATLSLSDRCTRPQAEPQPGPQLHLSCVPDVLRLEIATRVYNRRPPSEYKTSKKAKKKAFCKKWQAI